MKRLWFGFLVLMGCYDAAVCDAEQKQCDKLLGFDSREKCMLFVAEMNAKNKDPNKTYVCH